MGAKMGVRGRLDAMKEGAVTEIEEDGAELVR
jgi:hypothetical protein